MGYFYCSQHAEEAHHPYRVPTMCAVSFVVLVIPMVGAAADWWQHTTVPPAAHTSAASAMASPSVAIPPGTAQTPTAVAAPPASADTQVPPTLSPSPATPSTSAPAWAIASATDIPPRVLIAYMTAADAANVTHPGCHLQWQFLAALGEIESHHGRIHGSSIDSDGVVAPAIYGPALNGSAAGVVGSVADSNGRPARAMGPMQFIPSTWAAFGNGGNPQDIDDAAQAAANYVCHDGRDLGTEAGRYAAAFSYNHADWYAANVLAIYADYLAHQPGLSRPETPPPGADPAANATTGPAVASVVTPPATAPPTSADPAGPPFTTAPTAPSTSTSTTAPSTSTPPGQTSAPASPSDPPPSPSDPPASPSDPPALPTNPDPPPASSPSASPPSSPGTSTVDPSASIPSNPAAKAPSPASPVPAPAA